MAISQVDLTELKRISTNTYDADKACMNRVIRGISEYDRQVRSLKAEVEALKLQLAAANEALAKKAK